MAFPAIQGADTKNGTQASNSSSWTLTYPTNLASGDLILGFLAADGGGIVNSLPAGFGKWTQNQGAVSMSVFAKVSDGTETGTFSAGLAASEQGGWRIFRVTGWFGGSLPADQAGSGSAIGADSDGFSVSVTFGSGSSTPDPTVVAHNPANWATEDTKWFCHIGIDTSRTISVYPLTDDNTADVSGGSTGATLGMCTTDSAVNALNTGSFTISSADDWAGGIVAIRPSGGGGGGPVVKNLALLGVG